MLRRPRRRECGATEPVGACSAQPQALSARDRGLVLPNRKLGDGAFSPAASACLDERALRARANDGLLTARFAKMVWGCLVTGRGACAGNAFLKGIGAA
jgi:hypothetical protein